MTAVFRNRLIGSAILIIAAIVFLPDLLDGQKQVSKDDFKAIPERPEFASVAQQQVFAQDLHDASRDAAMALPAEQNAEPDPVPGTSAQQDVLPNQTYASVNTDSAAAKPEESSNSVVQVTDPVPAEQKSSEPATAAADTLVKTLPQPTETTKTSAESALAKAAWVVRVGSFSKEANANALISKLRTAGFATFTRKVVNAQGQTMVSVLVGPELKKEKLENSLSQLQNLAEVPRLKVVPFQPIENN